MPTSDTHPPGALREVALLFLRLGLTAFGGPAAHIAMFRDEVVTRRQWVTDAEFLDMMAAANLIPGPNSTETAIHLGFRRAGWPGLVAAGVCFIFPAFAIVLAIAMLYTRYGTTPAAESLLYGIEPYDLPAFLLVPPILLASGLAACLFPAWRAGRLDPSRALRQE